MKIKILLASLLAIMLVACSDLSSGVSVKIRLEGESVRVPARLEVKDTTYVIELSSRGSGEFNLQGNEGYAILEYNACLLPLYIDDKDFTVSLFVKGNSMRPSFSGKGAKKNFYMSNSRRVTPSYELEEAEYIAQLKSNMENAVSRLELMNFDEKFTEMERVRIRYDYMGTLPGYPVYHSMQTSHNDTLSDSYYGELVALLQGGGAEYLGMSEYRNALMVAVNRMALRGVSRTDTSAFLVAQLELIKSNIADRKVASKIASAMAIRFIEDRGIDGLSEYEPLCNILITEETDKSEFDQAVAKWQVIAKGCDAPNFGGLTDKSGKPLDLKNYTGKYVYVLCWLAASDASLEQMKILQSVIKSYAKAPVEFVSIAGDGSAQYWDKVIANNRFKGVQSLAGANRDFLNAMSVQLFPRAILIGPDGKIVAPVAPLPGSPKLRELLDSQLNG